MDLGDITHGSLFLRISVVKFKARPQLCIYLVNQSLFKSRYFIIMFFVLFVNTRREVVAHSSLIFLTGVKIVTAARYLCGLCKNVFFIVFLLAEEQSALCIQKPTHSSQEITSFTHGFPNRQSKFDSPCRSTMKSIIRV